MEKARERGRERRQTDRRGESKFKQIYSILNGMFKFFLIVSIFMIYLEEENYLMEISAINLFATCWILKNFINGVTNSFDLIIFFNFYENIFLQSGNVNWHTTSLYEFSSRENFQTLTWNPHWPKSYKQ